ncbi:DUF7282 domain-containing protein [Halorientalis halophila]|uniref:DUF7282 domain-containing protein n=1 Tax=Halorientalis halophila TaxID=3108499 RepID=UPI00300B529E
MLPRRSIAAATPPLLVFVAALALVATAGVAAGTTTGGTSAQAAAPNVTTFVAPGDALTALWAGQADDQLTRRPRVTPADALVVRVSTPGLGSAVAAQPGNTTTERFRALLSSDRASLTGVEMGTTDRPPRVIDPTSGDLAVREAGADTYDLIYDAGALRATDDQNGNDRADDGGATTVSPTKVFRLTFTLDGTSGSSNLGVFPASIAFSTPTSDDVELSPLPDQKLVGRTPLAPGTTLSIALDAVGHPFAIERTATVRDRRRPYANLTLDLSDAPEGVPVTVTARLNGVVVRETEGRIRRLGASFTTGTTTDPRNELVLRNVSAAVDGFLVVRDGPDGPLIANQRLAAGEGQSVTVPFRESATADSITVTAYVDVDDDGVLDRGGPDRPFRRDGDPLSRTVAITDLTAETPSTPTQTPTPTTEPPTTAPATASGATADTPATAYQVTDASGDGFGPLLALVALAAFAVAGHRRRA